MPKPIDLPLSWQQIPETQTHFNIIRFLKIRWVSLAEVPQNFDFNHLSAQSAAGKLNGVLIRGCNRSLAGELAAHGFRSMYIGAEALLDLTQNPFEKKSLKDLVQRGLRNGKIVEIPYSRQNKLRIHQLFKQSRYGQLPGLKYLYRTEYEPHMRCFVFINRQNEWMAAITLSELNAEKMHTELLLRHHKARPGTMEALIEHVFFQLQSAQKKSWSLGEVPFIKNAGAESVKARLVGMAGRKLQFAYNYRGLYHFKNKFNPAWEPVYLCANPAVSVSALLTLFIKSNLFKLVLHRLFRRR